MSAKCVFAYRSNKINTQHYQSLPFLFINLYNRQAFTLKPDKMGSCCLEPVCGLFFLHPPRFVFVIYYLAYLAM